MSMCVDRSGTTRTCDAAQVIDSDMLDGLLQVTEILWVLRARQGSHFPSSVNFISRVDYGETQRRCQGETARYLVEAGMEHKRGI